jgi:hypothetical protein
MEQGKKKKEIHLDGSSVIILEWSARVTSDLDLESSVTRCLYFREERVSAICPPVISFVFVSNLFCQIFAGIMQVIIIALIAGLWYSCCNGR